MVKLGSDWSGGVSPFGALSFVAKMMTSKFDLFLLPLRAGFSLHGVD
jgi:hypothetical protein